MQAPRQPHMFLPFFFFFFFFGDAAFCEYFLHHCRFLFVWRVRHMFFPFEDSVFLPRGHGLDFLHQLMWEFNQSINQSVRSPARGQLNRETDWYPSPLAPLNRSCETGLTVPSRVSPLFLPTQTETDAYWRAPLLPNAFLDGVHLYRQPPSCQSRVYRAKLLRTGGVDRRGPTGTGPLML